VSTLPKDEASLKQTMAKVVTTYAGELCNKYQWCKEKLTQGETVQKVLTMEMGMTKIPTTMEEAKREALRVVATQALKMC
jgi:hypothetical protein